MSNASESNTPKLPVRMLHDRVLVSPEVDSSARQSVAGLVIPATAKGPKRLAWAKVAAVGEHVRQVKEGDRILFDPDERSEVEIAQKDYILLRERDIHAVHEDVVTPQETGLYL